MKKITLIHYSDPGHGWVKVPAKVVRSLNIEKQISYFSHFRKKDVFLEEDRDAHILADALRARNVKVTYKEFHTDRSSKIRSYTSYNSTLIDFS